MPIARHIFGRDKPSLTALAHGDGTPVERRRALGLQQLFRPALLFAARRDEDTPAAPGYAVWRLLFAGAPVVAVVLVVILVLFWV
jgi:hypothetical protein